MTHYHSVLLDDFGCQFPHQSLLSHSWCCWLL